MISFLPPLYKPSMKIILALVVLLTVSSVAFAAKPAENEDKCVLCEWIVHEIEIVIGDNYTEHEIWQAVEKVCNFLPETVRKECDDFVEEFGPRLVQLLLDTENPQVVCTQLKLCPSADNGEGKCVICEWIVHEIELVIGDNYTEHEIWQAVEKICNFLPETVRKECDDFVEEFGPRLVQLILDTENPKVVCTQLEFCPAAITTNGGEYCVICELALKMIEGYITKESTEEEITEVVEKVCSYLPETLRSECVQLIDTYGPKIIDLLVSKIDPDKICTILGLCTSVDKTENDAKCAMCEWVIHEAEVVLSDNATETEIAEFLDNVCKLLPKTVTQECDAFIAQYEAQLIQLLIHAFPPELICQVVGLCNKTDGVVANDAECVICEWVMKELEALIENNRTEEAITKALEKVCALLPASVKDECDQLVETYGPTIINLLVNEFPPDKVCTLLGLCGNTMASSSVKAGEYCVICEYVISILEDIIMKNSTEEAIAKAVEHVCQFLPSHLQPDCDKFIETYAPKLIALIFQAENPKTICLQIGACQSLAGVNDAECVICEWVMKELEAFIENNRTEEAITKALEKVCALLPASVKDECDQLVETYGPTIINLLVNEFPPDKVCALIGVCSYSSNINGEHTCHICEWLVTEVEKFITSEKTEGEIIKYMAKLCKYLPEKYQKNCKEIVTTYIPEVIQIIIMKENPQVVCDQLHLCDAKVLPKVDKCHLCKIVAGLIVDWLEEEKTEDEILKLLDKFCTLLPEKDQGLCSLFVKLYGKNIYDLVVKRLQPDSICVELKLCT